MDIVVLVLTELVDKAYKQTNQRFLHFPAQFVKTKVSQKERLPLGKNNHQGL